MAAGYFELLLLAIYHQIELQKWAIGTPHSKARSTIGTGAVALSITAVAMAGFAALLSRTGQGSLAPLESIFGAFAALAIGLAVGGIAAIIGSMIISIRALRGRPIDQILSSYEFELVPKDGSKSDPGGSRRMSSDELGHRLQRNGVDTVRSLEEYGEWVAPKVHLGQLLLLAGIGPMSAVPAIALLWALFSRAPA